MIEHSSDEADDDAPRDAMTPRFTRHELQQRAIKGAYWTLLSAVFSIPVAFGVNILLARVLGPVDYGRLAYLSTIMTVVGSIISLGIGTGVVQFGVKAHSLGREQQVKDLLSVAQAFHLYVAAPIMGLLVLVIADVSPLFLIIALVFGILVPAFLGSVMYCFAIENKTAQRAQIAMMVNVLTQAAVVVVILVYHSPDAVWATRMIVGGVSIAFALFYIAPAYRRAVLKPRFRKMPSGFWKFSLPAGAASAVESMVSSRIEVVVLIWLSAGEAAGIFALAFGLASHLFGPAQALVGPLIPAVSGLHEVDRASVTHALMRTMRASATSLALILAAGTPFFAFLLPLIYGHQFEDAASVLIALSMAAGMLVFTNPLKAFIMARLSGRTLLVINLCALAADLGLMIPLIPVIGVWAAVIGNAGAALTQLVFTLIRESRNVHLKFASVMKGIAPYFVGCASCAIAWLTVGLLGWNDVASAVSSLAVGLILLLTGLHVFRVGLTRGDVDAISTALPRALRRIGRPFLLLCAGARVTN